MELCRMRCGQDHEQDSQQGAPTANHGGRRSTVRRHHRGIRHDIFHMHDVHTDYGMAWAIKPKEVEHLALYWLRYAANATGHPAVQLRMDSGEAKTTAVLSHCI